LVCIYYFTHIRIIYIYIYIYINIIQYTALTISEGARDRAIGKGGIKESLRHADAAIIYRDFHRKKEKIK